MHVQLVADMKGAQHVPPLDPERPDPELASNPEFGAAVRAARKALDLNQTELGRAIVPPTSQATISDIEKGIVASDRILPICRYLGIAPPVVGMSPMMVRWIAVGRAEHRSPAMLATQIGALEQMVNAMAPAEVEPPKPGKSPRH